MQSLLATLQKSENWKENLKKSARKNKISLSVITHYSPSKFKYFCQHLKKKFLDGQAIKKKFWIENQLRAFHWIVVAMSYVHDVPIKKFSYSEWTLLQAIFLGKQVSIFKYEILRLINDKNSCNKIWREDENLVLTEIVQCKKLVDDKANKWNDIARDLYIRSKQMFFRTGKQCRERWLNHLDPTKKHGQWTSQDDYIIAKTIHQTGKKWSLISKQLKDRTEHMVKNRFKSLLIKYRKIFGKNISESMILLKIMQQYYGQSVLEIEPLLQQISIKKVPYHKDFHPQSPKSLYSNETQTQAHLNERDNFSVFTNVKQFNVIEEEEHSSSQDIIKEQSVFNQDSLSISISSSKLIFCPQSIEEIGMDEKSSKMILRKNTFEKEREMYEANFCFNNNNIELLQVQSPSVWNHTVKTPDYCNFSPSQPFFMSFSQCENQFLYGGSKDL